MTERRSAALCLSMPRMIWPTALTYHIGDAHDGEEKRGSVLVDASRDGEIHDEKRGRRATQGRKRHRRRENGKVQITQQRNVWEWVG